MRKYLPMAEERVADGWADGARQCILVKDILVLTAVVHRKLVYTVLGTPMFPLNQQRAKTAALGKLHKDKTT